MYFQNREDEGYEVVWKERFYQKPFGDFLAKITNTMFDNNFENVDLKKIFSKKGVSTQIRSVLSDAYKLFMFFIVHGSQIIS